MKRGAELRTIPNASKPMDGYELALCLIRLSEVLLNLLKHLHPSDEVMVSAMRHAEYTAFHVALR